ncbi:hypothetical protein PoB_001866200 [Plakobranchus ocellatus]|uniref:Uncharacterized protein n=1 Tax=Plakobranchus ocellatus TaxID=259542 RepID=A0AAV3ZCF4_9GAST|nr:hypothetical protein PoB_001866200 [Plakobranchus ocellatus]
MIPHAHYARASRLQNIILSSCKEALGQGRYTWRHNRVLQEPVLAICDAKGLPAQTKATAQGVVGTVASESAQRSAGTLLSQLRAPPPAPWPNEGPESLRSPCCALAIHKNQTTLFSSALAVSLAT